MTSFNTQFESRIAALSRLDLFFIVGMPRSGTTWAQGLVDSHPEVCCRGESHFVDMFFSGLQKAYHDYNNQVKLQGGAIAHLRKYGGHVDELGYNNTDLQLLLYYAVYLMLAKWVGSDRIKVVGEKTPDNILSMNLLSSLFPRAKFLHVIRDGRDCALSGWYFNLSGVEENRTVVDTFDGYVERFLENWSAGVQFARKTGERIPDRYLEIRYEQLIENPRAEMTRILEYLDVDACAAVVDRCVEANSFPALSQGRPRGEEDAASFFRKGVAGDWRKRFSGALSESAWRIAGDRLLALGYPKD